jgi:hypothetical protein
MAPRALRFENLAQVAVEVERLRRRGYARAGQWGLAQVCEHLALALEATMTGFPRPFPWWVRRLLGPPLGVCILLTGRFPAGLPMPAGVAPPAGVAEEEALRHLRQALEQFQRFGGSLAPHPAFGRLSRRQWERLSLLHCAHHLSFLLPRDAVAAETPVSGRGNGGPGGAAEPGSRPETAEGMSPGG